MTTYDILCFNLDTFGGGTLFTTPFSSSRRTKSFCTIPDPLDP